MASYTTVVLAAILCLVQCWPEMTPNIDGSWKKTFSAERNTAVKDGNDKPIVLMYGKLTVFGKYDGNTDHDILANFIADKLSLFKNQPEVQEIYVPHRSLPLMFNMTVKELITVGPKPVKDIGVLLSVEVYAQKKKHQEAVSALKSLGSSF